MCRESSQLIYRNRCFRKAGGRASPSEAGVGGARPRFAGQAAPRPGLPGFVWDRSPTHPPFLRLSCGCPLPCRKIQQMWITRISSCTSKHWLGKPPALPVAPGTLRTPPPTQRLHLRRYVTKLASPARGGAGVHAASSCRRRVSRKKGTTCSSKFKTFQ